MSRRGKIAGCALALAAAVVLLAPETSHAQVRWGVGTGGRGGSGVYFGNAPNWGSGYGPYSGMGYGYGPYSGTGYGYGQYSGMGYGYSPGYGSGSRWDSGYAPSNSRRGNRWSGSSYSYGSSPNYYSGTYSQPGMTYYNYPSSGSMSYPSSGYVSTYPADTSSGRRFSGQPFYGATTPAQSDRTAHVEVQVPPNAEIWFEGQKTNQTGTVRHFTSPPLEPGQDYTYEIRAKWMENGQEVNRTKRQDVRAGSNVSVNFSGSDRSDEATPSDRVRPADTTTDRFNRGTTPSDRFSPDRTTTPDRGTTTPRETIPPAANPPGSDKPN